MLLGKVWKFCKDTGSKKLDDPHYLKPIEMAECSFQSQQPLVCDMLKDSDGLCRVAFVSRAAIWMGDARKSCVVRKDLCGTFDKGFGGDHARHKSASFDLK